MIDQIFNISNYHYNGHAVPVVVVSLLITLIGLFVILQTKKQVEHVAFFFFCLSLSVWLFTTGLVYSANDSKTVLAVYKLFTFFGVANIMPNLYLFSAAAAGFLKKQRMFVILAFLISNVFYLLAATTNMMVNDVSAYFWGFYPQYKPIAFLFIIFYFIIFVSSQVNLFVAYRRENIAIKKSSKLVMMASLLIGFTASIDFVPKFLNVAVYPTGFISMFIMTSLLAYSIIKYRAFDIETVIHKTLLWGLSFLIITVPILTIYRIFFPLIQYSMNAQIGFGALSLAVFALYLRLVQPKIDHLFQRRKADMEEIANHFAGDLVYLKGIDSLVSRIETVLKDSLYPQWIDVFIFNELKKSYVIANKNESKNKESEIGGIGDNNKNMNKFLEFLNANNLIVFKRFVDIDPKYASVKDVAKSYFDATSAILVIPLVLNERLLGIINLGKKANLSRYTALDVHFLTSIKNQSAIAISNSLIFEDIEEQVKKRTNELVEVQKQLVQAEKLATVGTLSGGVAHEINNPLTAILTNVQMLLAFSDDDTKIDKESLELIEEATQRCRSIVQKLMMYARKPVESTATERIDLAVVIERVVAFLQYQLEQDGVKITVDIEKPNLCILGNYNEMEQVLTNLILNARDSIVELKKSGNIFISLSLKYQLICLKVKDEGKGISNAIISKVFDPFFTTKDVGKGLGLGLSICHSIIEKHNGIIKVKSDEENGAEFIVELPQYATIEKTCRI